MFLMTQYIHDLIGHILTTLVNRVLKNMLHNLTKHLVISILQFHPVIVHLVRKTNQFIDYPHNILAVIPVLPKLNIHVVSEQEVEFVALAVVQDRHT